MEEEQVPPQGTKRKHTLLASEENSEDASPHKGQRPTKLPRSEQGGATHQADTPPTTTSAAPEQEQEEEEEKAEAKEQEEEEFRLKRVCFCPLVKRTQKFPDGQHYLSTKLSDDGIRRYIWEKKWPPKDTPLVSPTGLSKLGGNCPFLPEGEEWPKCKSCGVPLEFVFQLHTRDLPPSLKRGDEEDPFLSRALGERLHRDDLLLQCFKFCENDDDDCKGAYASETSVVRWVWAPVRPVFPNLKWRAAEAVLTFRQQTEKAKENVEEKKVEEEKEEEEQKERSQNQKRQVHRRCMKCCRKT